MTERDMNTCSFDGCTRTDTAEVHVQRADGSRGPSSWYCWRHGKRALLIASSAGSWKAYFAEVEASRSET